MTLNLNAKFSDEKSYKMPVSTADRTITLELQDSNGNDINKAKGPEIDTLAYNADIVLGGSANLYDGYFGHRATYTQAFDTNHRDTLDALAVQINAGESTFAVKRVDDDLVVTARSATALAHHHRWNHRRIYQLDAHQN